MEKFIVQDVETGMFWLEEGMGLTPKREDAFQYTEEQLATHMCNGELGDTAETIEVTDD